MSKRYNIVDDSLEDKLRVGETVLWIYGCLLVLAGVGFVIAECAVAEFGMAFVGLVATLSGAVLVAICSITFRMIRKVAIQTNQMQLLKQRMDELELEFDADQYDMNAEAQRDLDRSPPIPDDAGEFDDAPDLETQFAEAIASQDLATCRRLWPQVKASTDTDRTKQVEETFMALERQTSTELREAFAEQCRTENYQAALQTGERIVTLFPESRMSADFQAIRARIEAKAYPHETHRLLDNGHSDE